MVVLPLGSETCPLPTSGTGATTSAGLEVPFWPVATTLPCGTRAGTGAAAAGCCVDAGAGAALPGVAAVAAEETAGSGATVEALPDWAAKA